MLILLGMSFPEVKHKNVALKIENLKNEWFSAYHCVAGHPVTIAKQNGLLDVIFNF